MAVRCPMRSFPLVRHSRAGGNPVITRTPLDSRLRGNDLLAWLKGATPWDPVIISSSPKGLKGWHKHGPTLSGFQGSRGS